MQAKIEEFLRKKKEQEENTPPKASLERKIDPRYPQKFYLHQRSFHNKVHYGSLSYGSNHAVFLRAIWPDITDNEMSALMSGRLNPVPQWLGLIFLKELGMEIFSTETQKQLKGLKLDQSPSATP